MGWGLAPRAFQSKDLIRWQSTTLCACGRSGIGPRSTAREEPRLVAAEVMAHPSTSPTEAWKGAVERTRTGCWSFLSRTAWGPRRGHAITSMPIGSQAIASVASPAMGV